MQDHEPGALPMAARVRILDQFGRHAYVGEPDHAAWLIRCGYGVGVGTKKAIRAVRLTVPLALLSGSEVEGRASSSTNMRVKYTYREHVGEQFYVFQHKRGITGVKVGRKLISLRPEYLKVVRSVLGGSNACSS